MRWPAPPCKPKKGNITVSNLPGVFAQKTQRKLASVQGIEYGKASIDRWRREYLATCDNQCEVHLDTISNPAKLAGTLTEYKLPSGLVLQHLDVSSFAFVDKQERKRKIEERKYKGYLHQNLWRSIDQTGKATLLAAQPEMVYYDCEGECVFTWEFVPDVIEHDKTILVIGRGGQVEVFGYFVYGFKKGRMEVLTAGTGGS